MDLLPGGNLRTLFKLKEKFTEKKAAYVISCIGEALHHIHLHRIIHRDVKPENIMFDTKGIPKLIDFGISYTAPSTSPGGFCICDEQSGTFNYLSPEAMVPTRYHSFETDFWSLGIVLYEMLFQIRPLDHSKELRHELVQYSSQTYQSV
jgi:serine/threonine protein kinase